MASKARFSKESFRLLREFGRSHCRAWRERNKERYAVNQFFSDAIRVPW